MKKNELLDAWLDSWDAAQKALSSQEKQHLEFPREYRAFFHCFNQGQYYEAHDVLEHLWLRCTDADRSFYQALIQLAGAFVHFQKQAQHPEHPTHSRRVAPGRRLLALASARMSAFPSWHLGVDVACLRAVCVLWDQRASTAAVPLQSFDAPTLPFPENPAVPAKIW